jgi:hypothetical protein
MFFDSQGYASVGQKDDESKHRALDDVQYSYHLFTDYAFLVQDMGANYRTDDLDA